MTSSQPLQIALIGVGGIGSTFAFQLARAGHHVTAIARPGSLRLQQLQREGGIVNNKQERAPMHVTDSLDEGTSYDLVIVTLLAHQVEAVLPALRRSTAKRIQFMFNTFDPEGLRDAVGSDRCSFGMPFVQATVDKEGTLHATIGASGQKTKMNYQQAVDVFNAAGMPAVLEAKMLLWLRCHVPLCIAFESISVAGVRRGRGASWAESMVVARGLRESLSLLQRLGYPLYPSGKALLHASPVWTVASMLFAISRIRSFRELLATGAGECRALVDVLVSAALQANATISVSAIQAMKPTQD